ncbi:hypothetical protein [Niastella yeongjuensis]|uniref:hypothetical protein n=1 Tax=Niastella yeongjuensis TaxID=354355 RepID=UPI0015A571CD|nr:hypothetical protein [Niastella yeongjuensis]
MTFLQNGTEKGRIATGGNWLFNTTQDKGYLAQFNGNMWTSGTINMESRVNIAIVPGNVGDNAISIGRDMIVGGACAIGLGRNCTVISNGVYAFGAGANNTVTDGIGILGSTDRGIVLGMDSYAGPESIAIGPRTTTTDPRQFVCGGQDPSNGHYITDIYFGSGVQRNNVAGPGFAYTIHGSGAYGDNQPGGDITIAGGKGTGAGTPGSIIFSTAEKASAGPTFQLLSERARIDTSGNFGIGTNAPATKLDVNGTGRFNNVVTTSGHRSAVRTISSDIAIGDTDEYLFADATNNPVTVTLPPADGRKGQTFTIKKIAGSNSVYVATASAESVDGLNPYTITGQYKYVTVVASGNAWMIVSQN